jgi:carboxylesterase type B
MPQPSTAHNVRALTIGAICGALGLLALAPPNNPPPVVQTDTGINDPNAYAFDGVPGPVHTSELPYLFPHWNNDATRAGKGLAPASQALSTTMLHYWTNFVTNGNPNGPGLPTWPAYSVITDVLQLTPSTIATGTDVSAEHKCPFWNSLNRSL